MLLDKKYNYILTLLAVFFVLQLLYVYLFTDSLLSSDSYYYALQVQSLIETNSLKIPDSSPVYYLMQFFNFFGLSTVYCVFLYLFTSCIVAKLLLLNIFSKSKSHILLIFLIMVSPSLLLTSLEFPKQFLAFIVIFFAQLFYPKSLRQLFFYILLLALSIYLHLSSLPVVVALLGHFLVSNSQIKLNYKLVVLSAFIMLVGFFALYKLGHLDRFNLILTAPGFWTLYFKTSWGWLLFLEFFILLIYLVIIKDWKVLVFAFIATFPAWIPSLNLEPMSIGERFALTIPFIFLLFTLVDRIKINKNENLSLSNLSFNYFKILLVNMIILNLLVFYVFHNQIFKKYMHLNQSYKKVKDMLPEISDQSLVIVKLGLNYYLKYHLKLETFPYMAEDHWDLNTIWRIVEGVPADVALNNLSEDCLDKDSLYVFDNLEYLLIKENCFQRLVAKIKSDGNMESYPYLFDNGFNPNKKRPRWLYNKYKNEKSNNYKALPSKI